MEYKKKIMHIYERFFITKNIPGSNIQENLSRIYNQENLKPKKSVISLTIFIIGISHINEEIDPFVKYRLFVND